MLKLEIGMRDNSLFIRVNTFSSSRKGVNYHGFTLIEILVVLLIIGITFGFALLAFGDFGEKHRITTAAEQLKQYIHVIQQQAILESNTFGIRFKTDGYETVRFKAPNAWQTIAHPNIFRYHMFPTHLVFHFVGKIGTPAIIINASGEMNTFNLELGTNEQSKMITILGQSTGDITIQHGESR